MEPIANPIPAADKPARAERMGKVATFVPLGEVTSPTVTTEAAAHFLNRRPQTLRGWSQQGIGPLQPAAVIKRRLAWPVADIRRLLGITVEG